jgi:hypothetical protein
VDEPIAAQETLQNQIIIFGETVIAIERQYERIKGKLQEERQEKAKW